MRLLNCSQLILWLVALTTLCGAWYIEYGMNVQPCPLCLLQRWPYYILLAAGPIMHILRIKNNYQLMLFALICCSSAILGIYHSGVELHLWEGFTSCSAPASPMSTADLLAALERETMIIPRCDGIYFTILGFSLANWNVAISMVGTGYAGLSIKKL